ncbi:MAG TPA: 3-hydroxyacyl-CoA dehydrogenase family protein [Kofleriaceae bacterium]|nr:3-hydroxyacyl-CoA dehydrogenase family protein [Kofleriaceae bacterium]
MTFPTPDRIHTVTVIGAGTMGHGIAHVCALAGCHVRIQDALQGAAKAAIGKIGKNLAKGVELGKLSQAEHDLALGRLSARENLEDACTDADLVIEAVPEHLELKREIFSTADRAAPARALFASNTSSLSIAEIAKSVRDASRLVGMHFFNPVHLMKLVEVVRHHRTNPEAVAVATGFAERLGKTPITVTDSPGFASSRLGLVIGLEAMRMVEQGVASAADIDTAMKLGYGHPMGPLELTDLVGLDVRLGIADYLTSKLGTTFDPPQLLRDKVAANKLGKKTGEGFYKWSPDGKRLG